MPIIRREGSAHYGGTKAWKHLSRFPRIQHAVFKAVIARFALHLFQPLSAFLHFSIRKTQMQPARLGKAKGLAGLLGQIIRQFGPAFSRLACPALIPGCAKPLGLYPNQAEIAAAGAIGSVTLIQQRNRQPFAPEAPGNGGPHQPATNHHCVEASCCHDNTILCLSG